VSQDVELGMGAGPGVGRLLNAIGAEKGAVKSDQNIQKSEDVRG
jgi:hypothetical protein